MNVQRVDSGFYSECGIAHGKTLIDCLRLDGSETTLYLYSIYI